MLIEMPNLDQDTTGIEPVIYCGPKGGAQHECRVKVCNVIGKMIESDCFSIATLDYSVIGKCRLPASQLEDVRWWIYYNMFPILALWNGEIDTSVFDRRIKDITNLSRDFVPPWKK